jgi:sigma-B regulation protein RsbU (phosphoserine phosphatase)
VIEEQPRTILCGALTNQVALRRGEELGRRADYRPQHAVQTTIRGLPRPPETTVDRDHGQPRQGLRQGAVEDTEVLVRRLASGSYGTCESCNEGIEAERLFADPLARVCLDCLSPEEQRALEYDLHLAAKVQAELLPERELSHAGWEIHLVYQPRGAVSGDYADLIRTPDGGLVFVLGDVSGKGVSAAILTAHLQAMLRSLVNTGLALDEVLGHANRLFCHATAANAFATLVVGRLDASGVVEMSNAGHCPPLVARDSEVVSVPSSGLPLGMFATGSYAVSSFTLAAGERLFLYTDGLSESPDVHDREYGSDRIMSVLRSTKASSAVETAQTSLEAVATFTAGRPATDDLSLMVIRRLEEQGQ